MPMFSYILVSLIEIPSYIFLVLTIDVFGRYCTIRNEGAIPVRFHTQSIKVTNQIEQEINANKNFGKFKINVIKNIPVTKQQQNKCALIYLLTRFFISTTFSTVFGNYCNDERTKILQFRICEQEM